ncbi:MAG: HAMP domain-containing histidine kinase [Clostridia bacterium]|nr:HAMP domain-containing histidine kinase [Clostridia bacterium]
MKNNIARRLTGYFALALLLFALLAGTLFSLMFARHTADVTRRDMLAHASSIAQTIAHFTDGCEEGECKGGGFRAYMRYIGKASMSDLYLLDRRGEPVLLGEMDLPKAPLTDEALVLARRVFESGETAGSGFSLNPFHPDEMMVCAPVEDGQGKIRYTLLMRMPVNGVAHILQDAFYMLSACLLIAMTIAMIVSRFLSRRFVTPLHRMKDAAMLMAQGDYSVQTHIIRQDEIGMLAAHIDGLADKLAEAEKERARFDQLRQDFFSDISHELRTPIAVLRGNLELLSDGMIGDEEKRQQCIEQLYLDMQYFERLVNDLLELNRLKNPQFLIEMETINLMDVLRDSVRFMRPKADKKRIRIGLDEAEPFAVTGDYGRLRQMMIVLLDNAIKFSPDGKQVTVSVENREHACAVSVTDHGCGMDEEEIRHMFDRYFHNRNGENKGGTGLGLPIAKQIALRHGIDMTCRSKAGEGTCFTLVFKEQQMKEE